MKRLTVEEQWENCEASYQKLASDEAENYPVLDGLKTAWAELESQYNYPNGKPLFERGRALQKIASTPLAALFYFVDGGFYPPPELLLALYETYEHYMAADGEISLEEAFFGPPIPKAGNHARRRNTTLTNLSKILDMTRLRKEGKTKIQAAEILAEKYGGTPESIARTTGTFSTRKPEK
jgi:hypothetical protein